MFVKRSLTAIVLLLMLILVACGNDDGNAGVGSDKGAQEVPLPNSDPAEVIFYSTNSDSVESFDYRFGDSIRKKFPHYEIKYIVSDQPGTKLAQMITTGERFDVFFQSIGNFEAQAFSYEFETDMSDLIKESGLSLDKLEKSVIDAVKQASGGKLYGLPVFTNNLVLYYNKDLFDKFGENYPKDGMTWDEINEISRKMTRIDGDVQYFGFTHSSAHTLRMNPLSIPNANLNADTPTINDDERWKLFFETFYINPFRVPGYLEAIKRNNNIPDYNNFAKDKTVATYAYLSSFVYVWEEQLKEVEFDIVSLPTFRDMPGVGSQSYPSYFGITKMAKHKSAAMEVLKYMVSEEFQAELSRKGIIPVLNDAKIKNELGKESYYKDINWGAIFYNDFAPIPEMATYNAQLISSYHIFGTEIALDKVDINTALRNAEEDALKRIEAFKNQ